MTEEKKKVGYALWSPEKRRAAQEKSRATRAANKEARRLVPVGTVEMPAPGILADGQNPTTEVKISEEVAQRAAVSGDPEKMASVLEHFQYSHDPAEVAIWQQGEGVSPVDPPRELVKKYPELEFKLMSKAKIDRLGEGYKGWFILKDKAHPEGVKRGNDTIWGVRPKEIGESQRKANQERADAIIKGLPETQMEDMQRRTQGKPSRDDLTGPMIMDRMNSGREVGGGITVGRRTEQVQRAREQLIRFAEERARKKTVLDLGRR
jgi:hypothetical protein